MGSLHYLVALSLTGGAPAVINQPEKQHLSLIYFTTTQIHRNTDDPSSAIVYGAPTLLTVVSIFLRRDWSGYDADMSMALSGLGITDLVEQRDLIQRIHTALARWWETDQPFTLAIGLLTEDDETNSNIRSTRPTFARLNSIFDGARDLMESHYYLTPATKSSIEGLEKVTLDSADEAATSFTCVICLEGLLDQLKIVEEEKENNRKARTTETARLPCSHIFHETCIVRWLQISHLCPLCRHQMPIAQ